MHSWLTAKMYNIYNIIFYSLLLCNDGHLLSLSTFRHCIYDISQVSAESSPHILWFLLQVGVNKLQSAQMWRCIKKNEHVSPQMVIISHTTALRGLQRKYLKAAVRLRLRCRACGELWVDTGCPADLERRWTSNATSRFLWGDLEHQDWKWSPHRWSPSGLQASMIQICMKKIHCISASGYYALKMKVIGLSLNRKSYDRVISKTLDHWKCVYDTQLT